MALALLNFILRITLVRIKPCIFQILNQSSGGLIHVITLATDSWRKVHVMIPTTME